MEHLEIIQSYGQIKNYRAICDLNCDELYQDLDMKYDFIMVLADGKPIFNDQEIKTGTQITILPKIPK